MAQVRPREVRSKPHAFVENRKETALGQDHSQIDPAALEAEPRLALEGYEFRLHYQPKVDLRTGKVIAVEALVRWQHPTLGTILPAMFIHAAEQSGAIVPIGEWVLRTACAQNKAWQDQGLPPVQVAVNVSAVQFNPEDNLARKIQQILVETGLDPKYLELELTESAVMPTADAAVDMMFELRKIGVFIAIDNFGTGHSTLSSLKHVPLDTLHIASSYVRDITSDDDDAHIVLSIITMAHSLGVRVLAKGVETEDQLALLRAYDCDMMQGYLFSQPLPPDELASLLGEGRSLPAAGLREAKG